MKARDKSYLFYCLDLTRFSLENVFYVFNILNSWVKNRLNIVISFPAGSEAVVEQRYAEHGLQCRSGFISLSDITRQKCTFSGRKYRHIYPALSLKDCFAKHFLREHHLMFLPWLQYLPSASFVSCSGNDNSWTLLYCFIIKTTIVVSYSFRSPNNHRMLVLKNSLSW